MLRHVNIRLLWKIDLYQTFYLNPSGSELDLLTYEKRSLHFYRVPDDHTFTTFQFSDW